MAFSQLTYSGKPTKFAKRDVSVVRPLTPQEMEAPITGKTFFQRALLWAQQNQATWVVVDPGTESWNAWREYFERHLNWTPLVMRSIIDGSRRDGMTMPCEFPQMFDGTFREHQGWKSREAAE